MKHIHTLSRITTLDSKVWCFQYKILRNTLHVCKFLEPFFHKQVPFQANIECCSRFLEYALYTIIITTESYLWLPRSWYDRVFFTFYFSNIMSQKVQKLFLLKPSWNPSWQYISWKKYWVKVMKGKNYLQKNGKEYYKICKTLRRIWGVIPLKSVVL